MSNTHIIIGACVVGVEFIIIIVILIIILARKCNEQLEPQPDRQISRATSNNQKSDVFSVVNEKASRTVAETQSQSVSHQQQTLTLEYSKSIKSAKSKSSKRTLKDPNSIVFHTAWRRTTTAANLAESGLIEKTVIDALRRGTGKVADIEQQLKINLTGISPIAGIYNAFTNETLNLQVVYYKV